MLTNIEKIIALGQETEHVEFKGNNWDPEKIGQYISALSNAAALVGATHGYLAWGVSDKTHEVVGTTLTLKEQRVGAEPLEPWLAKLLSPKIDFRFHETEIAGKKVAYVEIPAATHTPVRFKDFEYIRVGSVTKKLRDFPEKERKLWQSFSSSAPKSEAIARLLAAGVRWLPVVGLAGVHALLIGSLAVFALWPEQFERLDLSKSLFMAIVITSPFAAAGAGIIYLGAMDRRPLEPEVRYAIAFATCTVAVCQVAALWQMFIADLRQPRTMIFWSAVGSALCSLPAWAKRHEAEEDERDRREGRLGRNLFFRGKRKGGEGVE